MTAWTPARIDTLTRMWADGASASQIAAALGGGATRNAVIGKVRRLGIGRAKRVAEITRVAKPRPVADAPVPAKVPPAPATARPPVPAGAPPPMRPPDPVPLLQLRDGMCRWPLGPQMARASLFCGEEVERRDPPISYCAHHARLAYQPSADRRAA